MKLRLFFSAAVCVVGVLSLSACASQPDHFYELNALPGAAGKEINPAGRRVRLSLTVPSLVDRSQIVVNDASNGVLIYDHERWAAPLADQMTTTLARDLEERRGDLVVGDGRFDRNGTAPLTANVDIVRVTARRSAAGRAGEVSIDAHWHILGAGNDGSVGASPGVATPGVATPRVATPDRLGGGSFTVPLQGDGFAAVARGYSQVLSQLADALAAAIPGADTRRSALR